MNMPNFLVIGAAKAGTTALYYYLKQHPQIYMSAIKEPDFFAVEGENLEFPGPNNSIFKLRAIADIETYRSLFDDVSNEIAIGEASTLYLYSPKAPERIKHYIPDAKLIAMLRHPVDRAYSHFLFSVSLGREPIHDFKKALLEENKRIQNNWSHNWHYKQRGFYSEQIKRYYDIFGKDKIQVYLYEDFIANSVKVVQDIYQFLEVDNTFSPNTSKRHNTTLVPKNQTVNQLLNRPNPIKSLLKTLMPSGLRQQLSTHLKKKNLGKPKLSKNLRRELIEVYREDILKLENLLERDLSKWLE